MIAPDSPNSTPRKKQAQDNRAGVLHLAPSMDFEPMARQVFDIALQTHRAGWRCFIASEGGPLTLEAERAALRHTKIPVKNRGVLGLWRSRRAIEMLIDRERPVLIHAHGIETAQLAVKVGTSRQLPFLLDLLEPIAVTAANRKALAAVLAGGGRVSVPSQTMRRHLAEAFGIEPSVIKIIQPGVDLERHEAARVTPERIKKITGLWRLPEQAALIVVASPFKNGGHIVALEALSKIGKTRDVYMAFVGRDDGARGALEKEIMARGLEGKVILPEVCEDWPTACWLATLVMAVNTQERGQAAEVLAAQAMGRPVIVTDCGANVELVASGETAWVVPPDDAEALAKTLETALAIGAERRIDLAIKTRAFVSAHFPMEKWRDSFFNFYDELLANAAPNKEAAA